MSNFDSSSLKYVYLFQIFNCYPFPVVVFLNWTFMQKCYMYNYRYDFCYKSIYSFSCMTIYAYFWRLRFAFICIYLPHVNILNLNPVLRRPTMPLFLLFYKLYLNQYFCDWKVIFLLWKMTSGHYFIWIIITF